MMLLSLVSFVLGLSAAKAKEYPVWRGGAQNGYDCPSPEASVARIDELMFKSSLEDFTKIREEYAHGRGNSSSSEAVCYNWYTDVCTHSPDRPLGFDFVKACHRHDFGWFNYHHQHGYTKSKKKAIEKVFRDDMLAYCDKRHWATRIPCKATALGYAKAVQLYPPNKAKDTEDALHTWRPTIEDRQFHEVYEQIQMANQAVRGEVGSAPEKRQAGPMNTEGEKLFPIPRVPGEAKDKDGGSSPKKRQAGPMNTEGKKLFPIPRVPGEAKDEESGSSPKKRAAGDDTQGPNFFETAAANNEALRRKKEAEEAVEAVKQAEAAAVAAKKAEVDKIANGPSELIRNDNSGMGKLGQDGSLVRPEKVKEKSNFRKEWDAEKAKRKNRKKIRKQAKIDKKAKKVEKARLKKLCGKKGKKGGKGGKDGEAGNDEKTGESGKPDEC